MGLKEAKILRKGSRNTSILLMSIYRERWLDSITDSMDMNLSKPQEIVKERGVWCAAVRGILKSQT